MDQNQSLTQNTISPQQQGVPVSPITSQPSPKTPSETQTQPNQNTQAQTSTQADDVSIAVVKTPQTGNHLYLYIVYAIVFVVVVFFWKRIFEWLKRNKKPELPAEDDGTLCPTCGGTGKVTNHQTITVNCGHCKGTGNDICHYCGGSGRYSGGFTAPQTQEEVDSMMECLHCEGSGFPKIRAMCCMCKGSRKETFQKPYEAPCPDCKGSGKK